MLDQRTSGDVRRLKARRRGGLTAGLGVAALCLLSAPAQAAPAPSCAAGICTVNYGLTGAPVSFVVPANVHSLTATVAGGSGGEGHAPAVGGYVLEPGGAGGSVVATVQVTPGQTLTVVVGGAGANADNVGNAGPVSGGYGGGGDAVEVPGGSDGAGGGGSFLFSGSTVLVASGGGGGGGYGPGGNGGAGGAAQAGADGTPAGVAGLGATTTAPGAGGSGAAANGVTGTGPASGPSTFGQGGSSVGGCPAGAGGGGLYGGGSGGCTTGAVYGPGGGGSGVLGAGVVALSRTTQTGDGIVALSWQQPIPTTTTLTASPSTVVEGAKISLSAKVTAASGTPRGTVTFRRGSVVVGTASVTNGTATLIVRAATTAGDEKFTASYQPLAPDLSSSSRVATVVVTAPVVGPRVNTGAMVVSPSSPAPREGEIAIGLGAIGVLISAVGVSLIRGRSS